MAHKHRKGGSTNERDTSVPERTCLVHRVSLPTNQMLRFVLDPDNIVTPDLKGNLPGRGVWITAERKNIDLAVKKALFSRGFKQDAKTDEKLGERVDMLLEASVLQALSLAQKSGLVTVGLEKVLEVTAKKGLGALFFASDGSAGSIGKVKSKLRYNDRAADIEIHQSLRSEQLDLAFGRTNVIHAALRDGGITELCLKNTRRLERFRSLPKEENEEITMA